MIGVSALLAWSSYITETSFQVPTIEWPTICCASLAIAEGSAADDDRLAADQAGQMLEPRRHALAGKRRAVAFQPQHQAMALDLERRARQHPRLRGRHHV